ncbi:hypothetical protein M3Y97_00643600 [Aphelenchoides bicaudatus]|nr:hypothetical protein M3Y97_00643600 [Aphelenchoides bicaudatus]
MDFLMLILSAWGLLAIFVGTLTNSFVILKLMSRQKTINDVFPLNMAFADIICLLVELLGILHLLGWPKKFVHVQLPACLCVLLTFVEYTCILLSIFSFFSYLLLRFFAIMWPLQCRIYLQKWHVYGLAAFNLLFSMFHMSDYIFVNLDFLFSIEKIDYFGWDKRKRPIFYEVFKNVTSYFSTSLFVFTTLLVAFTCYRLVKQGPYNSIANNKKQKAIRTICLSLFVFTAFQVLFVVAVLLYKNELSTPKILWAFFILRLYGYALNPFLYYKAEIATNSVKKKKLPNENEILRI